MLVVWLGFLDRLLGWVAGWDSCMAGWMVWLTVWRAFLQAGWLAGPAG
jgi:hypothetical protein